MREEKPYTFIGEIHLDPVEPMPYWDRSVGLAEFTEKTAQTLVELTGPESGSVFANVENRAAPWQGTGGVQRGVDARIAVRRHRVRCRRSDRAELLRGQLAAVVDGLAPWAAERSLVNFLLADEATDAESIRRIFGPERYARLAEVKRRDDPPNLFRFNDNIRPT